MVKTKETVEIILNALRDGVSQNKAIKLARINEQTYFNWIKKDPNFKALVETAKEEFRQSIQGKLEMSLWKRAQGYDVTETETEYIRDKDGNPVIKSQKTKVKHVAADVAALIFALTNVAPEKWINRQRIEQKEAPKETDRHDYNFDIIPKEDLDKMVDKLQQDEFERLKNKKKKDGTQESRGTNETN